MIQLAMREGNLRVTGVIHAIFPPSAGYVVALVDFFE